MHGISVSYPTGWSVQPATEPWTTNALPFFREPFGDFIYDPAYGDHLFIGIASQPLAGESTRDWAAPILAGHGCGSTDPITVDGAAGEIARDCLFAAVSSQERGYMIVLHVSDDDAELHDDYNLEWFEQVLGTVQLDPEAASSPPAVPGPLPTE